MAQRYTWHATVPRPHHRCAGIQQIWLTSYLAENLMGANQLAPIEVELMLHMWCDELHCHDVAF